MGAAFVTRRGTGGSSRLEPMTSTPDGSGNSRWKNLALSTNIYFLQATAVYTDDWTEQGYVEAFIENGEVEVLRGSLSDFRLSIDATSITLSTPYGNTILGSPTNLYRFC